MNKQFFITVFFIITLTWKILHQINLKLGFTGKTLMLNIGGIFIACVQLVIKLLCLVNDKHQLAKSKLLKELYLSVLLFDVHELSHVCSN